MKTAVEQFWNDLGDIKNNVPYEKQVDEILKCYYKAKEMEKEQIMDAYWEIPLPEEKYFEKTFKS
jgi:hypothetical protein